MASLMLYLENHASDIIGYERRAKMGETIGSGRMEKALDRAIEVRQETQRISWSEASSRALFLKVVELDGGWEPLRGTASAAART